MRVWRWWWMWSVVVVTLGAPVLAVARSLKPLGTLDAAILPDGRGELTFALGYVRDERFPYFTAPAALDRQDRWHVPRVGFRAGAADWVEIEAEYETLYLDEKTARGETNWQYGSGDARLHTKVRVRGEDELYPAFAVRFGTKLANANKDDRLGTDETDFDLLALVSKNFGPVRVHTNLGILLLGNPGQLLGNRFGPGGQDDLFVYSVAVESPAFGSRQEGSSELRLLGEISGLAGSRFGNDRQRGTFGVHVSQGSFGFFAGASVGFDTASEDFGLQLGATYAWDLGKWVEKIQ